MVQVMTCRLFGVKPLPKPSLIYFLLTIGPLEANLSETRNKIQTFHSGKCILKCRLRNDDHYIQGKMS